MRSFGIGSIFCVLSLVLVQVGQSQDQEKKPPFGRPGGGFGGGFPGGGGRGGADPLALVNMKAIQEELKLSEEQVAQIPEAVAKALAGVLTADQAKRLKQIEIQQRGTGAFADPKIAEKLNLSDEQKKDVKTLLEDSRKEMGELFKGGFAGGGDNFKKIAALRKETEEKIKDVLTADQKKTWKQMVGEEFKMPTPMFTRPGGENNDTPRKRPDFKKKTDNE